MNKTLSLILIVLAIGLIAFNVTMVNFENPFEGESTIALIGILAPLCAIILLLIYRASRKIQQKVDGD